MEYTALYDLEKNQIPFVDKFKNLKNIFNIRLEDEPEYYVILKDGYKQIRMYRSMLIAQTIVKGKYEQAINYAFSLLSSYINEENDQHQRMVMTAPVFQAPAEKNSIKVNDRWMMSFVLPKNFTEKTVPNPLNESIKLMTIPPLLVGSIRYSGVNNLEKFSLKHSELVQWLSSLDNYQVNSEPRFAQYNNPLLLPFLRRNEVHVTLKESQTSMW